MPKVLRAIPETDESITRPVVFDITRQLFKFTGIPEDTPILFPGPSTETTYQPGSTITKPAQPNKFNHNSQMRIEVDEEPTPESMLSTAVFTGENLTFFRDDVLGVFMKPVYSNTMTTISFRYRTVDKVSAERWRNEIRTRVSMNREHKLYEATYHYIIPEAFLEIAKEICRLREQVAGYGQTWNQYLTQHLSEKGSVATNLAGRYETWTIAEKQQEIQGWFDFEGEPEKGDRAGEAEAWEISFSFKFVYDKPVDAAMVYPVMIHNQLLSRKWRPVEQVYKPEQRLRSYGNSRKHFATFERDQMMARACRHSGISIPAWDEFLPATVPWGTYRAFTAMVGLRADSDLKTLFNMGTDLGQKQLHPEILRFMKAEAPYVHRVGESVFVLTLYRGVVPLDQGAITMDSNLLVSSVEPLDLREAYHVRLGFIRDLRTLTQAARDRMRDYGKACIEILKSIDCTLAEKGLLPEVLPGTDYIPKTELEDAVTEIGRDQPNQTVANDQTVQFNFQQYFFIEAHRTPST